MNRSKNTGFADRLSAAADAKKAQLERAVRARSEAESPAAVERQRAQEAVRVARDARIAERKATKLAIEARQAAALAAAQAAEAAAREVALPEAISRITAPMERFVSDLLTIPLLGKSV